MPLPWISVHTTLPTHPKSFLLGVQLDDVRAWTYLVQAWLYAAEHAADGVFRGKSAAHVFEHAAGWTGQRGALAAACLDVGFLEQTDAGLEVHDWEDYAGAHVEKLERDAARQRKRRALLKRGQKPDVTRTSTARHADVQGEREKEIEKESIKTLRAPASPRTPRRKKPEPPAQPPEPASVPPDGQPTDVHGESMSRPVDVTRTSTDMPVTSDESHASVQTVSRTLLKAYREIRGEPYVHGGAKDAQALKRVLASGAEPAEVERRWRHALELGEQWPGCSTLAQFGAKWNDLAAPARSKPSAPPVRDTYGLTVGRGEEPEGPRFGTCEACRGEEAQGSTQRGHFCCSACWSECWESVPNPLAAPAELEAHVLAFLARKQPRVPEPPFPSVPPPRLEAVPAVAKKQASRAKLGGDPFAGFPAPTRKRKAVPA